MWKKLLTIALLFPSPSYAACHKYSTWNYPWKQSCRDSRMVAMYVPKVVLKPAPPVVQPVSIDPAQLLNNRLNTLLGAARYFPDLSVNPLMEIVVPDEARRKAIEKLKQH